MEYPKCDWDFEVDDDGDVTSADSSAAKWDFVRTPPGELTMGALPEDLEAYF